MLPSLVKLLDALSDADISAEQLESSLNLTVTFNVLPLLKSDTDILLLLRAVFTARCATVYFP
jgi:hypothetical protein